MDTQGVPVRVCSARSAVAPRTELSRIPKILVRMDTQGWLVLIGSACAALAVRTSPQLIRKIATRMDTGRICINAQSAKGCGPKKSSEADPGDQFPGRHAERVSATWQHVCSSGSDGAATVDSEDPDVGGHPGRTRIDWLFAWGREQS